MKTILVFKTSVSGRKEVQRLRPFLDALVNSQGRWNFDLEDCDRILRVEGHAQMGNAIMELMSAYNHQCQELK